MMGRGGRGWRVSACAGAVFLVAASLVAACSTPTSGTGPDIVPDASSGADAAVKLEASVGIDAAEDAGKDVDAADGTALVDAASDGGDGSLDAGADGVAPDAGPPPCDGLVCNGQCLHTTDCSTCSGAQLLCAAAKTCVEDCAFCQGDGNIVLPIECYACDSAHANPIGTCESVESSYCLGGDYFGGPSGTGYHCGCPSGSANDCPGASQVCFNLNGQNLCATCGEPIPLSASGGVSCKTQGTSCNASTHSCE